MNNLKEVYGYCILPKNTILFRGHTDASLNDCMFFATKKWVAGAFNQQVQIWKTTKDIELLFLVEYVNHNSWTTSALPHLYNNKFPNERNVNFNDNDIKHGIRQIRDKLVRKLYDEYNISGWLSSLENKVEMEVCLFDKYANESQLMLIDTVDKKDKSYFEDSLDSIDIFPSKLFFEATNKQLSEKAPKPTDERDHYKQYERMMNNWIEGWVRNGMEKIEAQHYLFDLRTKLKI